MTDEPTIVDQMNEMPSQTESPKNRRSYRYVGREDILSKMGDPPRTPVSSLEDIRWWTDAHKREVDREGCIAATFVIDLDGALWIADRRSEHVACARGGEVLSAGEVFFAVENGQPEIARISNQSTGYCPEVSSWGAVDAALRKVGILHSGGFDPKFEFRRCPNCRNIAIVKDGDYSCLLCGEALPEIWNIDSV